MTESQHPRGDRPVYPMPARRTRGARPLTWLFLFVAVGAAAYGVWRGYPHVVARFTAPSQTEILARVQEDLQALRTQADALAARQGELVLAVQKHAEMAGALETRVAGSEQAVGRLADAVEGGRTHVQLAAVEQLLLMANDRLLLARDGNGALRALELADERLARLNDPRLFRVRETLAAERAAVAKLALPDVAGITLALGEMLKRVPELPLRARVPERFESDGAEPILPPPEAAWFGRLWAATKTGLANIFALRRTAGPGPRLLPPQEEALVAQILTLKLEGARLALLASDGRTFQELLTAAREWLVTYYDETDPDVRAAFAEIDRLARTNLAPEIPAVGGSLAQVRAAMGAR